jgi:eukaryotic-like serine/threonine-protein kinase
MALGQFIKSKDFRKHGLRIILIYLGVFLFFGALMWWYTDHGQQVAVPDLSGMTTEQAIAALDERNLDYLVVDSIYDEDATPGAVLSQSPAPESKVKEGRQVFLTVYRFQPPQEKINIEEGDYAQVAIIKLQNKGIKYEIVYVPNNGMIGSVISITHKGKKMKKDEMIARGERVVLTVGEADTELVRIPDLYGMSYRDALIALDTLHLMIQPFFDGEPHSSQDSAAYHVCRHQPPFDPASAGVPAGRIIDVWLSTSPCERDTTQH